MDCGFHLYFPLNFDDYYFLFIIIIASIMTGRAPNLYYFFLTNFINFTNFTINFRGSIFFFFDPFFR